MDFSHDTSSMCYICGYCGYFERERRNSCIAEAKRGLLRRRRCGRQLARHSGPFVPLTRMLLADVGWANVGWHNPENTATPNANALLKESVELDRHYVFFYCSPSRSSLLSGRLPMHVSEDNGNACLEQGAVPLNMTMLPAKLAKAGVYSVHAGK